MGKKIAKIILIVLLLLLLLVIIHTIRNFIIIRGLQDNIEQYISSTNYHAKSVTKDENNVTMDYYKKDQKELVVIQKKNGNQKIKLSMYNTGSRIDLFCDATDKKTVELNKESMMTVNAIYNYVETDNNWQTLLASIFARISKTECNGKECYVVNNFISSSILFENSEVYIEKDTGLPLKVIVDSVITEKEYEFNNVSDEIFTEPDISQYELIEK